MRAKGGRFPFGRRLFMPHWFRDSFLRQAVEMLNRIANRAGRNFEAARFMRELARAVLAQMKGRRQGA